VPLPPVEIGDVIAGKYTVEAIIGEGGMGVVVAARHLELDQRVAIKFLLPEIATQGTAAERFRREARSAARIRGEHVCRVLDVGTLPSGVPFLVMEHLEGCDLALELDRRGRLPLGEAVEYVLQACEGLAEAHAANIVHRDLKPANLFLAARADGSRRVKLLDFGVSKSLTDSGEGNHALTQTSSLVGSPLYMSPEQLSSSKSVDARSDIWALGAVLYELVAGKPPFNGESIPQLVHAVMNNKPASLEALDASLPRGIDAVVLRALQKQRDDRYPSVAELAKELAPFAPRHALLSVSRVSRLLASSEQRRASAAQGFAATESSDEPPQRASNAQGTPLAWSSEKRETRRRIGVGVVLALLSAAAVLLYLWRARTPEVAAPAHDAGDEVHVAAPAPAEPPTTRAAAATSPEPAPVEPEPSAPNEQPLPEPLPSEGATPAVAAPAPVELERAAPPSERRAASRRERATPAEAAAPPAPPTLPAPAPTAPREPPDKPGLSDFGGRR
jgi:serine/threonine-protein kinase